MPLPTPTPDVRPESIVITDETTKAEIELAIAHLRSAYLRGPKGIDWQDQHHARLNALLDDWELAPSEA